MAKRKELKADTEWIKIGYYTGAYPEIVDLNLNHYNAQFFHIDDPLLEAYFKKYSPDDEHFQRQLNHLEEIRNNWFLNYIYVLVPINLKRKLFDMNILWKVQNYLLLMFPSDFRLIADANNQMYNRRYFVNAGLVQYKFTQPDWNAWYKDFLRVEKKQLPEVSKLFSLIDERLSEIDYLNICTEAYLDQYRYDEFHMCYIHLFIALESLIIGSSELTFKMGRLCGVLIAKNANAGKILFDNMKVCYDIRSRIVHGEPYKKQIVHQFYYYLRKIVSRAIIEIILLNIKDKEQFFNSINELGFGDKKKMMKSYPKIVLDREVYDLTVDPPKVTKNGVENYTD